MHRIAGIETDMRFLGDKRVVRETQVQQRVLDDKCLFLEDGMTAKRYLARRLAGVQPLPRLEPLPIRVHEADETDLDVEQALGHAGYAVEAVLRRRIEQAQRMQTNESYSLVERYRRFLHDLGPQWSG